MHSLQLDTAVINYPHALKDRPYVVIATNIKTYLNLIGILRILKILLRV